MHVSTVMSEFDSNNRCFWSFRSATHGNQITIFLIYYDVPGENAILDGSKEIVDKIHLINLTARGNVHPFD